MKTPKRKFINHTKNAEQMEDGVNKHGQIFVFIGIWILGNDIEGVEELCFQLMNETSKQTKKQ